MTKTAVVILAYNSEKYLRQFLPTLIEYTTNAEIWVVDNNSSDNTKELLSKGFSESVRSVFFNQNYGFAGGYNRALAQIEADNLILLNSDVEVSEGWLEPLIESLTNNSVAAVQPKVLSFHSKGFFEYAGASGGFIDKYGYPFCRGRVFDECEKDRGQFNDSTQVFWATGACLGIRKKVFFEVGGFDDRFFAHMEEIDLCWRLQLAGYTNMVEPLSAIYHVGGGTLHKSNPRKTFLNFRNGLLLLLKNLDSQEVLPIIFARLVLDGVAALKMLLSGDFNDFLAVLKAHFSFYGMIPYALKQRKLINRKVKVSRFNSSIVWEYFIKNKKTFNAIVNA